MSDRPLLVMFENGWVEDGVDVDALPRFRQTIRITLERPPLLQIVREAEEQDFEDYPEAFKHFTRQSVGLKPSDASLEGYPLAYWPVVAPAELKMCLAREIYTVQQLAPYAKRNVDKSPPQIIELAKRAAKMLELHGKVGKFEALIGQLTGERDVLAGELGEARNTISTQNSIIATLKLKVA
jgi:hypothetical protein